MNSPSKSSGHEHAGMAAGATTSGTHTHHHHASHAGSDDAGGPSSHSQPDASTRDPVCGMAVTAASEHRSTHLGNTYLFCSTGCKAKFDADPARYASGGAGIGTGSGHAPHHHASTAISSSLKNPRDPHKPWWLGVYRIPGTPSLLSNDGCFLGVLLPCSPAPPPMTSSVPALTR